MVVGVFFGVGDGVGEVDGEELPAVAVMGDAEVEGVGSAIVRDLKADGEGMGGGSSVAQDAEDFHVDLVGARLGEGPVVVDVGAGREDLNFVAAIDAVGGVEGDDGGVDAVAVLPDAEVASAVWTGAGDGEEAEADVALFGGNVDIGVRDAGLETLDGDENAHAEEVVASFEALGDAPDGRSGGGEKGGDGADGGFAGGGREGDFECCGVDAADELEVWVVEIEFAELVGEKVREAGPPAGDFVIVHLEFVMSAN